MTKDRPTTFPCSQEANEGDLPRLHTLKTPDRSFIKVLWSLLLIFILCPFVIDPPLTDKTFSPSVVNLANNILLINLFLLIAAAMYLVFYRKKTAIIFDESGIHIQDKGLTPWKSIIWYKVDIFSSRGIRKTVVKTKDQKIAIVAEDGKEFIAFEKDFKHLISFYSPLATNYQESQSSKTWGYIYILIVSAIHLIVAYFLNFSLIYLLLVTPEVLFIIMMIYVEKIRGRPWGSHQ